MTICMQPIVEHPVLGDEFGDDHRTLVIPYLEMSLTRVIPYLEMSLGIIIRQWSWRRQHLSTSFCGPRSSVFSRILPSSHLKPMQGYLRVTHVMEIS
ncbi:hypothetical protein RRG08_066315 [Elysia crispata]|uniref:Uncharacterized protein n=1 Tax=Elysia crispata TaxID=231223 RepID=A0AAE1AT26_9GAST|nr:hypothetical protein RRG08_066315 [Elysia crispata]